MTTLGGSTGAFLLTGNSAELRFRPVITLSIKARIAARLEPSSSCEPQTTEVWFPVFPGTEESIPPAPPPTTNASPSPPNSVEAPPEFNPEEPDLCLLFQDTLPVNTSPIYPEEQTADVLSKPYNEIVSVIALVRSLLAATTLNYSLTLDDRAIVSSIKVGVQSIKAALTAEATSYVTTDPGTTIVGKRVAVRPFAGTFLLQGASAGLSRLYSISAAASDYVLEPSPDTALRYDRLPLDTENGTFVLLGQEALLQQVDVFSADSGSFSVGTEEVALLYSRAINAQPGSIALGGQARLWTGTIEQGFELTSLVEDDLFNLNV